MKKHQGRVIEKIVRRSNFSLSELAALMNVNRRSLYNWFCQSQLRVDIIYRLGCILDHDFSLEFPDMFTTEDFQPTSRPGFYMHASIASEEGSRDSEYWKDKYLKLLEEHHNVLRRKSQSA